MKSGTRRNASSVGVLRYERAGQAIRPGTGLNSRASPPSPASVPVIGHRPGRGDVSSLSARRCRGPGAAGLDDDPVQDSEGSRVLGVGGGEPAGVESHGGFSSENGVEDSRRAPRRVGIGVPGRLWISHSVSYRGCPTRRDGRAACARHSLGRVTPLSIVRGLSAASSHGHPPFRLLALPALRPVEIESAGTPPLASVPMSSPT